MKSAVWQIRSMRCWVASKAALHREHQFTSDASHELRTPLTAMKTILNVMRDGERPTQEYRQALDDLAEETDRLQGLVENLLQLARGEKGLKLHKEEIDLSLLLADVADLLRPLADNKQLTLTCDLPPSLVISGNTDQLIRLIVNLLDNAIKYTEEGTVTLSAHEDGRGRDHRGRGHGHRHLIRTCPPYFRAALQG